MNLVGMRDLLKTLDHSTEPDRRRSGGMARDFGDEECAEGGGGGNCGGGAGYGSDREETLEGGEMEDGEEELEKRGGGLWRSVERERFVGYEPRSDRIESCWRPWGMSGSEERSRSPERKEFSIWRSDDGVHDDDEMKDFSDSPSTHAPVAVADADTAPTAVVVAEEPAFRVGAGLTNLGNTCFMNSVLQCLVRTAPLLQGLFMIGHCSPCFSEEFCLLCCLREHVQLTFGALDEVAPYRIAANINYFSPDFVRYQQEDAHEFLQCLLDKLEKYPMRSWNPFSATSSENLVKQVFGGSLISRLRCSKCNHISYTPEDLIDFSLEIDDVSTLEGALDSFTKLERIEDILLTCDGCYEKVSMEKQFMVDKAPSVASFHLKRFKNDGITVEKIAKHVEYPLSLNLHPYTVGQPDHIAGLIYDLYAVIVHDGSSSSSGHYFCYVRSSPSTWHEFDDSTVTGVSESHVLSREAYILFYAKRGTSWFSNANEVSSHCPLITSKYSPSSVLEKANQSSESDSSTENLSKRDVRVNRHKEFSEAKCQPACSRPQNVNFEVQVENEGHGIYSDLLLNGKVDDNNDVDMEDSSYNFDMLLNGENKENTKRAMVSNNSPLNFDMRKDEANTDRKELADNSGSSPSIGFLKNFSKEKPCITSSLNNEECAASSSSHLEAGNFTNKNPVCAGGDPTQSTSCQAGPSGSLGEEAVNVTKKNTINRGANMTKPTSCQISGSPEATKASKPTLRKRAAEKPIVDDPRKKQLLKAIKRTNMPMTRANKYLALLNVSSPNKKTKKASVSPAKKLSPRTACRKNQNRVASPSVRSAIFR